MYAREIFHGTAQTSGLLMGRPGIRCAAIYLVQPTHPFGSESTDPG